MSELLTNQPWLLKALLGTGFFGWLCTFIFQHIPQITERKWRFSVEKFNLLQESIKPFLSSQPTNSHQRAKLEHAIYRYSSRHIDYKLVIKAYQRPQTIKNLNILRKHGGALTVHDGEIALQHKDSVKPLPSKKKKKIWTRIAVTLYVLTCLLAYLIFMAFMLHKGEDFNITANVFGSFILAFMVSLFTLLMIFPSYMQTTALYVLNDLNSKEENNQTNQKFF